VNVDVIVLGGGRERWAEAAGSARLRATSASREVAFFLRRRAVG
jgi:hypothetical protein